VPHLPGPVHFDEPELLEVGFLLVLGSSLVHVLDGQLPHDHVDGVRRAQAWKHEVDRDGEEVGEEVPAGAPEDVLQSWMIAQHGGVSVS
jgi:hypothetical protein